MLEHLASWSFRRRFVVIVGWLALAVVLTVASGAVASPFTESGRLTGTDSDKASQLLAREFPAANRESALVVFADDDGFASPAARAAITSYLAEVATMPHVDGVTSPLDAPAQVSADGRVAFASVDFAAGATFDEGTVTAGQMEQATTTLDGTGVRASFTSGLFSKGSVPPTEVLGLLAACVILLLAFGSVVAMGLPVVTALVGVVVGLAGVGFWTTVVPTPDFTPQVATMIGIGVGIDYALFIITRYRGELVERAPLDALAVTMGSAGRAVVLAGCTVVVSVMGMFVVGLDFLHGLALGTATAVLVAVAAAVTLLPALLSLVTGRLQRSAHKAVARRRGETLWHRWARVVQRRPGAVAVAGLVSLLVLAAPVLSMRLASADEGNDPVGSTTRTSYDLLAQGFGPGVNGPLLVAVDLSSASASGAGASAGGVVGASTDDAEALQRLGADLAATPGVALVTPAVMSPSGQAAVIRVFPTTSPQSVETAQLVRRLRTETIPARATVAHVGGRTASDVDFAALLGARLPLFIGAVLALSFGLLLVVFRSLLVPLKAVAMNLLSIAAAYGVMVAVFQWGWFGSIIGIGSGAPIEPWVPMLLFAIVFGLSMDYEVFLLSSIKERFDATGDNASAVVEGLASTARIITAAAAIMIFVFGSFVFGDVRALKLIGFGLAAAVFIDATIVRMVLVPATMELLGDRNWWLPRWLGRIIPKVQVEREPALDLTTPGEPEDVEAASDVDDEHVSIDRPATVGDVVEVS